MGFGFGNATAEDDAPIIDKEQRQQRFRYETGGRNDEANGSNNSSESVNDANENDGVDEFYDDLSIMSPYLTDGSISWFQGFTHSRHSKRTWSRKPPRKISPWLRSMSSVPSLSSSSSSSSSVSAYTPSDASIYTSNTTINTLPSVSVVDSSLPDGGASTTLEHYHENNTAIPVDIVTKTDGQGLEISFDRVAIDRNDDKANPGSVVSGNASSHKGTHDTFAPLQAISIKPMQHTDTDSATNTVAKTPTDNEDGEYDDTGSSNSKPTAPSSFTQSVPANSDKSSCDKSKDGTGDGDDKHNGHTKDDNKTKDSPQHQPGPSRRMLWGVIVCLLFIVHALSVSLCMVAYQLRSLQRQQRQDNNPIGPAALPIETLVLSPTPTPTPTYTPSTSPTKNLRGQ